MVYCEEGWRRWWVCGGVEVGMADSFLPLSSRFKVLASASSGLRLMIGARIGIGSEPELAFSPRSERGLRHRGIKPGSAIWKQKQISASKST